MWGRDRAPLQLPPQQGDPCSNQSQLSILDRVVEIHPNALYCSKYRNTVHGTVAKYYIKFTTL
jgi:hypothetical protein